MKVTINKPATPERKLKAVMTKDGRFYFNEREGQHRLQVIHPTGDLREAVGYSLLVDVVNINRGSTPIYAGDSVTIKF